MSTINDLIAEALDEWATERTDNAKRILNDKGIKQNTDLAQSIYFLNKATGGVSKVEIYANDYYVFVDEGVQGLNGTQDTTGRFKYKNMNTPKSMVNSIQKWVASRGLVSASPRGKSVTIPKSFSLAWAIAKSVKKKGIRKTLFWSDTFNDNGYQLLVDKITEKLGDQFEITIN